MELKSGIFKLTFTKTSYTLEITQMSGYDIVLENSHYALKPEEVCEYLNNYYGTNFKIQ